MSAADISSELQMDPAIRDWVLIPLVLVIFFLQICKNRVARLLQAEKKPPVDQLKTLQTIQRSSWLRMNASILPAKSYQMRKQYFCEDEVGALSPDNAPKAAGMNMQDPSQMGDMMKSQLLYLPNMVMMGWINYYFPGFVVVKVPFPLSYRFKQMFQRGIDLSVLDVRYVTAFSLYFICLQGLSGLVSLLLGDSADIDETKMMMESQMAMTQMGKAPGQSFDGKKAVTAERENVNLIDYKYSLPEIESNLLKRKLNLRDI